jgi:hypothetical protein
MRSLPLTTLSCRSSEAGFAISLHSLPILSHITNSLSSLFYHTEWIFFVPSKTERVPKGSIRSHPFVAQLRFNVELPSIRSHSFHGVEISSHLELSFLITLSSLTVSANSLTSSVIATLCVPLLRNKVFIIHRFH